MALYRTLVVASLLSGALVCSSLTPRTLQAQAPSADQVQRMLQQQPALAEMLRQRIRESGLTPEQIRSRLQASGYPSDLLDAYIGSGGNAPDPGNQILAAAAALGLPPVRQDELPVDTGVRTVPGQQHTRVFGVDVFQRTTTQFLPLLSGPVPSDYRLGAGDELVLILTGDVELAYQLPVTREGFLIVPQVGQVFVSNLTLEQLRDVLYSRLSRVYSGVRRSEHATTRFEVSVANVRANQVYVVGEVRQPGAYQISSLATVLTALYAASGVTENANTRDIQLQRQGKTVARFDLYDYLLRGNTRSDIRLETGDVVFVSTRGPRVALAGAVTRPAIYEVKPGETLDDVIRAAGGFLPQADLRRVTVHRLLPAAARGPGTPPRAVIDVALSAAAAPAMHSSGTGLGHSPPPGESIGGVSIPPLGLLDGDSVVVDAIGSLGEQPFVGIAGMVQKPGYYPWREGMTLRDLMLLARGPSIGADLREAEIARLPHERANGQLAASLRVPLDSSYLFERDSSGRYVGAPGVAFPAAGSAQDVPLEPFDNVLIFRQPDFELQRTVTITGKVRYPGPYALQAKDERLSSLVKRAGGLTSEAYTSGIRFYRPANGAGRINVNLDRALKDEGSREDIVLQPGDSIEIPQYSPSVKVSGAVNSPGSVMYRPGASLDYYLGAVGGFAPQANEKYVTVRFANGEVRTPSGWLFFKSKPEPGPGSEIFVPIKPPGRQVDPVSLLAATAQVLSAVLAIIVVLNN
jgi:protein involved in polysaccharide export with SLBB domain